MRNQIVQFAGAALLALGAVQCTTGVEPSPDPGIVRVMIKGVESDTMIVIQGDSSEFSRWDLFNLYLSTGRIYQGEIYSTIYNNPTNERKGSDTANILAREWLDGTPITPRDTVRITPQNSRWVNYIVFESYVPPGEYTRLYFALTATEMEIFIPKHYLNPVQLPPGTEPGMDFDIPFTVVEGGVTEIRLEIYPYQSLARYRDAFYFDREVIVSNVTW
jgi:hypothetical protein